MMHWIRALLLLALFGCQSESPQISDPTDPAVDSILRTLSLEEKVGQMTQLNLELFLKKSNGELVEPLQLDSAALEEALVKRHVGSIMNFGGRPFSKEEWRCVTETIRYFSTQSDGIPVIYAFDAVHGANYIAGSTLYPHQLAMSATWNDSLVRGIGAATARETRSAGIHWIFSPLLDVARQPLWVQFFETFGEDTYLTKRMGRAIIEGYQNGDHPVAACAKHFVGYGFPHTGKDRTPVMLGERTLRETHLPSFSNAIASGLKTIMIGSNEIDGIPLLASKYWITDVLRKEVGFNGVVVSDWGDVAHLYDWHRIASDNKESTMLAIQAGLDMAMVPNDYTFTDDLSALVEEGTISEIRIDASVRRILQLKMDFGILEGLGYPEQSQEETNDRSLAYTAALESITLLKNESDLLPLKPEQSIAVLGPGANSQVYLNGSWSRTWQGTDSFVLADGRPTLLDAVNEASANVSYVDVVNELGEVEADPDLSSLVNSDVVVLCLGELPSTEKPGDIRDLSLSKDQWTLAESVLGFGKPVVAILLQDRPRVLGELKDLFDGIIMAYRPGQEAGSAMADLLFGEENFSGKLPFTYPGNVNDLLTYDHKSIERIGPDWGPSGFQPAFEFGHGLSYSAFEYSSLSLDRSAYALEDTIHLSVMVENRGAMDGKEVVQVFVTDEVASIAPPIKRLRSYEKTGIRAGEKLKVSISIPVQDLAFVDQDMQWIVEPGWFTLWVDTLEARFEVKN